MLSPENPTMVPLNWKFILLVDIGTIGKKRGYTLVWDD